MNVQGKSDTDSLRIGILPLIDSAPYVAAAELGYYREEGLAVSIEKDVSWANIRDKLASGALDAAQFLAPLPAMTRLGVSGIRVPLVSGLTTSLNGNVIAVSHALAPHLRPATGILDSSQLTAFLNATGKSSITFGVVHGFSCHTLLIRRWLRLGGVDPDGPVRLLVVPPSQIADTLANGLIDGFCAGEPWGSEAVSSDSGEIACFGSQIWPRLPEKVLCVTEAWASANPQTHQALIRALVSAGCWLTDADNQLEAATMLSDGSILNIPANRIEATLRGKVNFKHGESARNVSEPVLFDTRRWGRPSLPEMAELIVQSGELFGTPLDEKNVMELTQATYRPDVFDSAIFQDVHSSPS